MPKLTAAERVQVIKYYTELKWSGRRIAEHFNVAPHQIAKVLSDENIPTRHGNAGKPRPPTEVLPRPLSHGLFGKRPRGLLLGDVMQNKDPNKLANSADPQRAGLFKAIAKFVDEIDEESHNAGLERALAFLKAAHLAITDPGTKLEIESPNGDMRPLSELERVRWGIAQSEALVKAMESATRVMKANRSLIPLSDVREMWDMCFEAMIEAGAPEDLVKKASDIAGDKWRNRTLAQAQEGK